MNIALLYASVTKLVFLHPEKAKALLEMVKTINEYIDATPEFDGDSEIIRSRRFDYMKGYEGLIFETRVSFLNLCGREIFSQEWTNGLFLELEELLTSKGYRVRKVLDGDDCTQIRVSM